jgi:hypothetical protein
MLTPTVATSTGAAGVVTQPAGTSTSALATTVTTSTTFAAGSSFKVVGVLEVEIEYWCIACEVAPKVLEDMLKKGIAEALEINIENVVKLLVSEIGQNTGLRRLESNQNKRYEVSYEILVPTSLDPDVVVQKANRIAVASTAESEAFRQALKATDGVLEVGQVASKTSAYKIAGETTTVFILPGSDLNKSETSHTSVVVGVSAGFVGLVLAAVCGLLIKRKMAEAKSRVAPGDEGREADDAVIRIPSSTLLQSRAIRQAWQSKQSRHAHDNQTPVVPIEQTADVDAEANAKATWIREAWLARENDVVRANQSQVAHSSQAPEGSDSATISEADFQWRMLPSDPHATAR